MKTKWYLTLLTIVLWTLVDAAPRSEQEALAIAMQHFNGSSHVMRTPAAQPLSHSWTATQANGTPAFYVFNRGEENGFVIISAEDRTRTVLGYADEGHFDAADIPINMRAWLDYYAKSIAYAASLPEHPASVRKAPQQRSYTPIEAICKTKWNQGDPYNLQCPYDSDNKRSVTGCVATAAAQVMKVHNYPTKGTGSHSYTWTNSAGQEKTLSANFGNTTYNWANMLNTYTYSSKQSAKNAVATLMYHCGVACEMGYSSKESGAGGSQMMNGLITYFGYDPGIRTLLKDYMGEEAFLDAIIEDLQIGHPVFFTGYAPSGGGHAFVCDGLDADGLVHINWGWGGQCDGHFHVSVLNPDDQGIGGTANNDSFTEGVTAYSGIQPNLNGQSSYTVTADSISVESLRFSRYKRITVYADVLCNRSIATWAGKPSLLVYKDGELYKAFQWTYSDVLELGSGYFYTDPMPIPVSLSSLPAGEYELVPGVSIAGETNRYEPLYVLNYGVYRYQMTVTNTEIILTEPEPQSDEPAVYDIWVGFIFPEGAPEQVDLVGTFDEWQGTPMTYNAKNDSWSVTIRATAEDYFAIVEHDNWDNNLQMLNNNEWTTLYLTVQDHWNEDEDGKFIGYDLSDSSVFRWASTSETTGIETVSGEASSARKMLRDGQLFILREGQLFTPQGIKVHD